MQSLWNNGNTHSGADTLLNPNKALIAIPTTNIVRHSSVKHNPRQEYFYIDEPGCRCILEYELRKKVVVILHTNVPEQCGGKGYGKKLAEAVLSWIERNDFRMIIECEFVQKYVEKNRPQYKKYLIK